MNNLTTACILPGHTDRDLAVRARQVGLALFALSLAAFESWLRFPIRPLFDGYPQSSMSRISSAAAAVYHRLSQ